jgi:hypothetical protein
VAANRPACARLLAVAPAGRSAASYTITRDTTLCGLAVCPRLVAQNVRWRAMVLNTRIRMAAWCADLEAQAGGPVSTDLSPASVVAQKIFTILRAVYPSRLFRKHGNGSYQRAAVRVCDADLGSE